MPSENSLFQQYSPGTSFMPYTVLVSAEEGIGGLQMQPAITLRNTLHSTTQKLNAMKRDEQYGMQVKLKSTNGSTSPNNEYSHKGW